MDDDLEDKVFYQTYVSYMKFFSKFAMSFNSGYCWRLCLKTLKHHIPEVLLLSLFVVILVFYLQAAEGQRNFISRISSILGFSKSGKLSLKLASPAEKLSWQEKKSSSAVYAIQGRRPRMEDRWVIEEDINSSSISLFAIFDGHGGEFAADFAKNILIQNLHNKIIEAHKILSESPAKKVDSDKKENSDEETCYRKPETNSADNEIVQRKPSFNKKVTRNEDYFLDNKNKLGANQLIDADLLNKVASTRPISKDNFFKQSAESSPPPRVFDAKCYIEAGKINFGKMISDEVLAADYKLVEKAKKETNVAGTTALIAIMHKTKLIVANVGDSRGVMSDKKGNAIPLSFDHKPQQVREHKRIQEAGGFIAFKGVWRVAGILATSRALGDYPLKERKLVIADPDILTFDLNDHKPPFLILASDGLWDTFSNEESVSFIKEHLHEPDFGAKSITLQSYIRGSVDNVTVLVIAFKNGKYEIGSST